jgi:hypothetical protein
MNLQDDDLFRNFVQLAELSEAWYLSMTIAVGGTIVSGRMVGSKTYLKEIDELLGRAFQLPPDHDSINFYTKRSVEQHQEYVRQFDRAVENKGEYPKDPKMVHLVDARFIVDGKTSVPAGTKGFPWRCEISEIQGYTVGAFGGPPVK